MRTSRSFAAVVALCALCGCSCSSQGITPVATTCTADAECGPGSSCAGGTCRECPSCADGERCVAAKCVPGACADVPCPAGSGCVGGRCLDSQCDGVECEAGEACVKGLCHPAECETGSCLASQICLDGSCSSIKCVGVSCPAGWSCADVECVELNCSGVLCGRGAVCKAGRCVAANCVGVTCGGDWVCAGGRCSPSSCTGVSCARGAACVDGRCQSVACVGVACSAGAVCAAGRCIRESCGGTPCAPSFGCLDSQCREATCLDLECPEGSVCKSGACLTCPQCAEGERCVGGECLSTVCEDLPCPVGTGCQGGICIEATCAGVQCPDGTACAAGSCYPTSCAGRACGFSEVCVEGRCEAAACVGVSCAPGEDCAAGRCLPQSCGGLSCAGGAVCVEERCEPRSCVGIECGPGTDCALGRCLPSRCGDVDCASGQVCVDGACTDLNCQGLACDIGSRCSQSACVVCGEASELNCLDGLDGDCDRLVDCADPDCTGSRCDDGRACTEGETCRAGTCEGGAVQCAAPPGECHASSGSCNAEGTCAYDPLPAGARCSDDGRACTDDVCDGSGGCIHPLQPAGAVCRAASGSCDREESCSGTSGDCPTDQVLPSTSVCRPSAGVCDAEEKCDGLGKECTADGFQANAVVCRDVAGACDVAERCTGSSASCPADGVDSVTMCRASAGECDVAETCDGSDVDCPVDRFEADTVVCRNVAGACDEAELCTGADALCPADAYKAATVECRPAGGGCDLAETCTGSSADCPPDPGICASFTWSPSVPVVAQAFVLDASASMCLMPPCTYTWTDEPPGSDTYWLGTGQILNFAFYTPGPKYVHLLVSDVLGATGLVEHEVVVAADTTAPSLSIATPAAGTTVSRWVTIAGAASDDIRLSMVEVQVEENGPFRPAVGTANWTYDWDTQPLAQVPFIITVRATDFSGNTTTQSVTVNVDNSALPVCDQYVTSSDLASVFSSIAGGSTLCLAAGDYGTFTGGSKSSMVTLRKQNATDLVSMALDFDAANNIRIDQGITITSASIRNGSQNLRVNRCTVTGLVTIDNVADSNIVFDGNQHLDVDTCAACPGGALNVYGTEMNSGVTIQNSIFRGGTSGGVYAAVSANIIGNEVAFKYVDASISLQGASGVVVRNNYIHHSLHGIVAYDGLADAVIENNVIDLVDGRPWSIEIGSDSRSIIRHNTLAHGTGCLYGPCGEIDVGSKPGFPPGEGTVVVDNIATNIGANGATLAERHHNLLLSAGDSGDLTGSPTFSDSTRSTGWRGYRLEFGTLGSRAASDGEDIGIWWP